MTVVKSTKLDRLPLSLRSRSYTADDMEKAWQAGSDRAIWDEYGYPGEEPDRTARIYIQSTFGRAKKG